LSNGRKEPRTEDAKIQRKKTKEYKRKQRATVFRSSLKKQMFYFVLFRFLYFFFGSWRLDFLVLHSGILVLSIA